MDSVVKQNLVNKAIDAKENSYSPYSKFRVGCSLLTIDDIVYTGCNVENVSYGLSICAERTAICKAVSDGHRQFKAIAVATDLNEDFIAPCGACRQFIAEFGLDWKVILVKNRYEQKECSVKDILPYAFDSSMLVLNNLQLANKTDIV